MIFYRRSAVWLVTLSVFIALLAVACHLIDNSDQMNQRDIKSLQLVKDKVIAHPRLAHEKRLVKEMLSSSKLRILETLELAIPPVTIYICRNAREMKDLAYANHGHHPPEWANGLAYARARSIYLHRAPKKELKRTLTHELVHIALGQGANLPFWLNEGLSVVLSETISWRRMWTLNEAAMMNRIIPLKSLKFGFPKSGTAAQLAYAQSASFTAYLQSEYTHIPIRVLIKALINGEELEQAFKMRYPHSLREAESKWRVTLERGPIGCLALIAQESTLWSISIVLFIIGGAVKLHRRKLERERLDEDEDELWGRVAVSQIQNPTGPIFKYSLPPSVYPAVTEDEALTHAPSDSPSEALIEMKSYTGDEEHQE